MNSNQTEWILELKAQGMSSREIASIVGCSKSTVNYVIKGRPKKNQRLDGPRILFFDLENTPSIGASFQRWKVNLSQDSIIREGGSLLSACWKFNGDTKVTKAVLTSAEAIKDNDARIICELYEAWEQADMVVAHNAKRFDVPLFKTRLLYLGLPPPKTVKVIDTLEIVKKLKFNSNKLDSLCRTLDIGSKMEHEGIELWLNCMAGNGKALKKMVDYNEKDVLLLEELYHIIKPFDTNPHNAAHFFKDNKQRCPVCGSENLTPTGSMVYTPVSEFEELSCGDCGHRSRKRNVLNSKEKRASLLVTPKASG